MGAVGSGMSANGPHPLSQAAIVIQAICIFAHRSPVKSHDLGLWAFGSTLISTLVVILHSLRALQLGATKDDPVFILRLVSLAATVPLLFANISIPRRPIVFHKDKPVDAQFTTSILSRFTWSWGKSLAKLALEKGDLDEKDIPAPDHNFRARDLVEAWHKFKFEGPLLKNLVRAYLPLFLVQWTVTVARSFVGLGPFWAMLRVIELLEQRSPSGERPIGQILAYIVSLAVFSLLSQVTMHIPSHFHCCRRKCKLMYCTVDARMGQLVFHIQDIHPSPRPAFSSYFRKVLETQKC